MIVNVIGILLRLNKTMDDYTIRDFIDTGNGIDF